MEVLGSDHIGFGFKDLQFDESFGGSISIVGGRPCSWGGPEWVDNLFGAPAKFYADEAGMLSYIFTHFMRKHRTGQGLSRGWNGGPVNSFQESTERIAAQVHTTVPQQQNQTVQSNIYT
jgi:hypothetical protein